MYFFAVHAVDSRVLNINDLQALPPESYNQIRFNLHPASQLVRSQFPILKIWQNNQSHAESSAQISLQQGGVELVILREVIDIEFHLL